MTPDGKSLLVALTLLDQPVYLLAAHSPANVSCLDCYLFRLFIL